MSSTADHDLDHVTDALRAARYLYRVILAIGLVTIVYAIAVQPPKHVPKWTLSIRLLIDTYERLYDDKTEEVMTEIRGNLDSLIAPGEGLGERFSKSTARYYFLDAVRIRLSEEICECRVDINDLDLSTISKVQGTTIYYPQVISVVRTSNEADTDSMGHSSRKCPRPNDRVGQLCELSQIFQEGQVLSLSFSSNVSDVPNAEIQYSMKRHEFSIYDDLLDDIEKHNILRVDKSTNTRSVFLSPELPSEDRTKSIAELLKRLESQLDTFLNDVSITFLGIKLHTAMLFYSFPVALAVLLYYYLSKVVHLNGILGIRELSPFSAFSWLPITRQAHILDIRESSSYARMRDRVVARTVEWLVSYWRNIDVAITLVFLPLGAIVALLLKFRHMVGAGAAVAVLFVSSVGVLLLYFGSCGWYYTSRIRQKFDMAHSSE